MRIPAGQEMRPMMWSLLSVIMPLVAAWFVTKLMNQGDFDPTYFLAALLGALLLPFAASLLAWELLDHSVAASVFYDLKPRCAGAFIGGLVFDAMRALRA
jgi:hypothetical protein